MRGDDDPVVGEWRNSIEPVLLWRKDWVGGMVPRLKQEYSDQVMPALQKRFRYENSMQVPRVEKIVLNMGVGEAIQNPKSLETAVAELMVITGQKPCIRRAKQSISNFKLRAGTPIGCMVTLRGARMYEFLDRLVNFSIPRVRDFRGLSTRSFDGRGNYSFGVQEQVIFPEIDLDKIEKIRGLNVTIVTTARTDEEALELMRDLGMPFRE